MSRIWIKLYIGQSDPNPRVFGIDGSPRNISRMKTKIKEAGQNYLANLLESQKLEQSHRSSRVDRSYLGGARLGR